MNVCAQQLSLGQKLLADLIPALQKLEVCKEELELRSDESMARHTTLRLGGPADIWAQPSSHRALSSLLAAAQAQDIPVTFVGHGSNLLVRDGGIRGVVVQLGRMTEIRQPSPTEAPELIEVQAGASTGRLLQFACVRNLGGVEFLGGVPGSVGGGLRMNAGTYLGEFTNVVVEVQSIACDGQAIRRVHQECGFRYRGSDLPSHEVIVSALLRLTHRSRELIEADVKTLRERRKQREPTGVANNGSTFKNPPGDYAGRLIETADLKGVKIGAAFVSPVHANWLVVERGAAGTASQLLALIDLVRERVLESHGVELELEVKIVGEDL